MTENFSGFQVVVQQDGDTTIVMDKWFASALKDALGTSAAQTQITEDRNYTSDMYETMVNQLDQIDDQGPADGLSSEQLEELSQLHN